MIRLHEKLKDISFGKFRPGINKKYLLIISGLMWTSVGIFLDSLAFRWLLNFDYKIVYYLIGFLLAVAIHFFGFGFIANQNITRVEKMERSRTCLFAFQPWYSYLIVVFMMSLGMFMRNSFIPKNYLSIIYFGIGSALFLSSLRYYKSFVKMTTKLEA